MYWCLLSALQEIIDWSRALMPQVARVGRHYNEWVHSPVHRPLRLFQSDLVECLTKSPWWLVPLVWIPIVMYICHMATVNAPTYIWTFPSSPPLSVIQLVAVLPLGVLLWTFIEYCLHRFVFHLDPPSDSRFWIPFHFVIHGQHHKVSFSYLLCFHFHQLAQATCTLRGGRENALKVPINCGGGCWHSKCIALISSKL